MGNIVCQHEWNKSIEMNGTVSMQCKKCQLCRSDKSRAKAVLDNWFNCKHKDYIKVALNDNNDIVIFYRCEKCNVCRKHLPLLKN